MKNLFSISLWAEYELPSAKSADSVHKTIRLGAEDCMHQVGRRGSARALPWQGASP